MRTRRREREREQHSRREADRNERRSTEETVADPPRTVDDLLDRLAAGDGVTYEEAALVGGIEEGVGGFEAAGDAQGRRGGW
ncbi:hypothetical protein Hbl1158_06030 [Halobaculum sp. CBA1158]|uniref:hypothetical protein n=1 Tax=Halobaculum sp. CBA1158 TaxID=2904243 RepID=UPI001F45B1B3|nr:hypothetical protein [Halobaculum sp. CBA1158]UIP00914.1 hypothetical protein Hbl1158_06030 [Halobaculum sp. CBA1158]